MLNPLEGFSDSEEVIDYDASLLIEDAEEYESSLNAMDFVFEIAVFSLCACPH